MDEAEFLDIPGHPGYSISRDGRVRGRRRGMFLRPSIHGGGYKMYSLDGKMRSVAHLLCLTFHGPKPEESSVAIHLSGPESCSAEEVRWGTRSEAQNYAVQARMSPAEREALATLSRFRKKEKKRRERERQERASRASNS